MPFLIGYEVNGSFRVILYLGPMILNMHMHLSVAFLLRVLKSSGNYQPNQINRT